MAPMKIDPWSIYWIHFKGEAANSLCGPHAKAIEKRTGAVDVQSKPHQIIRGDLCQPRRKDTSGDNPRYANSRCSRIFFLRCYTKEKFNYFENKKDERHCRPGHYSWCRKNCTPISGWMNWPLFQKFLERIFPLCSARKPHAPIQYFNHLKIQKACQYLLFTDMNVRAYRQSAGHRPILHYFSRMFTSRLMGVSPQHYLQTGNS